jgi:hypothetical protein
MVPHFRHRLEYNQKQDTVFGFDDVERIYTFIAANRMLWAKSRRELPLASIRQKRRPYR